MTTTTLLVTIPLTLLIVTGILYLIWRRENMVNLSKKISNPKKEKLQAIKLYLLGGGKYMCFTPNQNITILTLIDLGIADKWIEYGGSISYAYQHDELVRLSDPSKPYTSLMRELKLQIIDELLAEYE